MVPAASAAGLSWSCLWGGGRSRQAPEDGGRRCPEAPQKPRKSRDAPASGLFARTGKMTRVHKYQPTATCRPLPSRSGSCRPRGRWAGGQRGQSPPLPWEAQL